MSRLYVPLLAAFCMFLSLAVLASPAFAEEPASSKPLPKPLLTLAEPSQAEMEMDLDALEKSVGRAVVKIIFTPITNLAEIKSDPRQQEQYGGQWSNEQAHGSGFFISPDGLIVTNAHVVEFANRRSIKCKSPATGNTSFELELIGVGNTETIDLALLKLKEKEIPRFKKLAGFETIPFLRIADSDAISPTEEIAVLGYPENSDDMRIKAANLSGRQYLESFWELIGGFQFLEVATASAVQSGNSGGAAITARGDLVGIPARGDWTDRTGWLIPSNVLIRFLDEVAANDQGTRKLELLSLGILSERTFPGMAVLAGMPEDFVDHEVGISIEKVSKESLAEEWGIQTGDILLAFRNKERNIHVYLDFEGKVKTTGALRIFKEGDKTWDNSLAARRNLSELVMMSKHGQEVELHFVRKGVQGVHVMKKKLAFREVLKIPHLGTYEVPDFVEWAGMIIQNFHDGNVGRLDFFRLGSLLQEGAVVITHTDSGSLAQDRNLGNGFAISAINGIRVRHLAELRITLKTINDAYDAWRKSPGFVPEKTRYRPENYALIRYHVWDEEVSSLVQREVTVPIEEARAAGRSLDKDDEK